MRVSVMLLSNSVFILPGSVINSSTDGRLYINCKESKTQTQSYPSSDIQTTTPKNCNRYSNVLKPIGLFEQTPFFKEKEVHCD